MKSKLNIYITLLLLISNYPISGQQDTFDFRRDFQYQIFETQEEIKVDGVLDEATWSKAEIETDFWQKVPFYEIGADPKTEVMLSYNDNYLFVAARCFQTEELVIQSLKRDEYWNNDGIAIILDPLNSKSNSTLFGTSAVGVQWDATHSITSDTDNSWNNKWFVETTVTDSFWSAEFAIPFRILRYDQKQSEWGLNFVRNLMFSNQYHNWTAVPESFWPANTAFAGALIWDKIPEAKSSNYNIIPYIRSAISQVDNQTNTEFDVGLDAKIALNSSLNLDLTIFPDFSQIEADELVTNLTRFDIGLPEKRTFFLENADLFSGFGTGEARPFFSRKIGLDNNFQQVPILYGARLTGNIQDDIRVGLINIHSQTTDESLGQNQSALSLRKQFGSSFIQGMFLNRQAFNGNESIANDYGRNLSLEGRYQSNNGQISAWGGTHLSFKPNISENTGMYNGGFIFRNPRWDIQTNFIRFEENYYTDMGFSNRIENYDAERDTIVRLGYSSSYSTAEYRIRPQTGTVAMHRFGIENLSVLNPDWSSNEQYNRIRYFLTLKTNHEFRIRFNRRDLDLLFPFSFTDAEPLPRQRYENYDINFEYLSDDRKAFSYDVNFKTGGFYNGSLTQLNVNANYRIQPWANFSAGYQWYDINFPDPYGANLITALLSKIEIGFSRNILWSTQLQFVEQSDFIGINSRLQWRFSPMSDIFLVWIDNYDIIEDMIGDKSVNSNNRALVLKINYWY